MFTERHHTYSDNEDDPAFQTRKQSVQFGDNDDDYSRIVGLLYYVILRCTKRSTSLVNFVIALINRSVLIFDYKILIIRITLYCEAFDVTVGSFF